MLVQPCFAAPFQFERTGDLSEGRFWHTTSLLSKGKVSLLRAAIAHTHSRAQNST
jgi:hypothetical protein